MIAKPTGTQLERLRAALMAAFPSPGELNTFFSSRLGHALEEVAPATVPHGEIVRRMLAWVEERGMLRRLLTAAGAWETSPGPLAAVCGEILRGEATPGVKEGEPWDALVLGDDMPFVDRAPLRRALRSLVREEGPHVLVIDGPPRSGTSYCFELFRHVRTEGRPDVRLARVDLSSSAWGTSPAEVMGLIARDLGLPGEVPRRPYESEARWVVHLATWLEAGVGDGGPAWVVLDGFDHPAVPPSTHDLIASLALRAARRSAGLRVILLGYAQPLPLVVREEQWAYRIEPLTEDDLAEYLGALTARYHAGGKPGAEAAEEFLELFRQLPPGDPSRAQAIATILREVVRLVVGRGRAEIGGGDQPSNAGASRE